MISTAVQASAVARVLGIKTEFKNIGGGGALVLPQRIALFGQGSSSVTYPTTKLQITSAIQAAEAYGFGSPIHLAALQLFPTNGDGVGTIPVTVYPLEDDGSGVASAGDITPSGAVTKAGSFTVKINNIASASFVVAVGDTVADIVTAIFTAISAELNMPMVAVDSTTKVDLTSKWKGLSANDLVIEIDGPTDTGITFALTQPSGGLVNPDIDAALALMGDIWETMVLNCLNVSDTATLNKYQTFGDGRWGALVKKPLVVFSGETQASVTAAIAVPDARKTDRVNAQLVAPGSKDLPFVVAARQLARIAVVANDNPPHDYGSQPATGLTPGTDGEQWDYPTRDQAVKAGSSTVEVKDGVVNVSDTVTFYHPTGDPLPAYRFVVDIVRLQNVIFNLEVTFNTPEWDGAPLIPNSQPTINPKAKRPKDALAASAARLDQLGLAAIISDPETAKANSVADISTTNPKRLDMRIPIQLSGNTNIKSIDLDFGFFFGTGVVVS